MFRLTGFDDWNQLPISCLHSQEDLSRDSLNHASRIHILLKTKLHHLEKSLKQKTNNARKNRDSVMICFKNAEHEIKQTTIYCSVPNANVVLRDLFITSQMAQALYSLISIQRNNFKILIYQMNNEFEQERNNWARGLDHEVAVAAALGVTLGAAGDVAGAQNQPNWVVESTQFMRNANRKIMNCLSNFDESIDQIEKHQKYLDTQERAAQGLLGIIKQHCRAALR